jgi:hypothetical protein
LTIARTLAAADPRGERDVAVALWKLAETDGSGVRWADVVAQMHMMQAKSLLAAADEGQMHEAEQNAAKETAR